MKSKPYFKWTIDCGARGIEETWARSAAEAVSRVKWRLRQRGIFPITTYWGEPVAEGQATEDKGQRIGCGA